MHRNVIKDEYVTTLLQGLSLYHQAPVKHRQGRNREQTRGNDCLISQLSVDKSLANIYKNFTEIKNAIILNNSNNVYVFEEQGRV